MSALPALIAVQNMINVNRLIEEQYDVRRSHSYHHIPFNPLTRKQPPFTGVFRNPYGVKDIGKWKLREDGVYERVLTAPGLQYCTVRNDPDFRKITILSTDMGFTRLVDVLSYPEDVKNSAEYSIIAYLKAKKHQLVIQMYKV